MAKDTKDEPRGPEETAPDPAAPPPAPFADLLSLPDRAGGERVRVIVGPKRSAFCLDSKVHRFEGQEVTVLKDQLDKLPDLGKIVGQGSAASREPARPVKAT